MISGTKAQAKSIGYLATMGHLKLQKRFPTWGDQSYMLPYMPSSESDRQVYLNEAKLGVLTSRRLLEISHLRPIDHLFSVLVSLSESNRSQVHYYDNFIDFAA